MSDALEKGIAIGKANIFGNPQKKAEAIEYFKQALLENPKEVQAWLWIANLVDNDTPTRKYCFQKVLELDPQNTYARQMLDFILETEPNFKWIKEQASPLQPFFDSLQRPQPPFLVSLIIQISPLIKINPIAQLLKISATRQHLCNLLAQHMHRPNQRKKIRHFGYLYSLCPVFLLE
jgi:tetratricopeptide (TPR) repeat protein